jgi:hypothetical protein
MKNLILTIAESADHEFKITMTFPTNHKIEIIEILAFFFPEDFKKAKVKDNGDNSIIRIFTYDVKLVDKFKGFAEKAGKDGMDFRNDGFKPLLDPDKNVHDFGKHDSFSYENEKKESTEKKELAFIDSTKIPTDERLLIREINGDAEHTPTALGVTEERMSELIKLCVKEFKGSKTPVEAMVKLSKHAVHANELYFLAIGLEKLNSVGANPLFDLLSKLNDKKKD